MQLGVLALCLFGALAPTVTGPAAPAGSAEGDLVELDGEVWQVHDGKLYSLDDPALTDPRFAVSVTGSRVDTDKKKTVRAETITNADIAETGARTLADVLEEQGGIQVNSSLGLGQEVQMDGMDGRHVLILIDGRPVNGKVNNRVDVGRIPVSAGSVERIEIVRGPMSALYGSEAIGGVVNIITKRPSTALGGEVELGTQVLTGAVGASAGLHARGGAGPVAVRIDVNAANLPGIDRGGLDDKGRTVLVPDGKKDLPDRRQLGLHAEAALPLSDTVSFRTQVDGSSSTSVARTSPTSPFADRARNDEWSVAALLEADVLARGELGVDLRLNRARHVFDKLPGGGEPVPPSFCRDGGLPFDPACPAPPDLRTDATIDESRLELRFTNPFLEASDAVTGAQELSLSAGGVLSRQQARRVNGDGDNTLPGGGERDTLSLYAELLWRPLSWLSLVPGGRADVVTPGSGADGPDTALGPKISARADGPWGIAARASYGRGFRLPSFEERLLQFDHSELGYTVVGNPALVPELSHGLRGEVLWDPLDEVSLGGELYLNLLENLIDVVEIGTNADGTAANTYGNIAWAYTSGINLRAGLGPVGGLRFDVTYQYLINAVDTSVCPEDNAWFCSDPGLRSLPLRAPHALDATLRWRLDATGTTLFVRGDALADRIIDRDEPPAPGYVIISAGVRQPIFDHAELTVGLDNVFDAYDPIYGPKPGRSASLQLRVW